MPYNHIDNNVDVDVDSDFDGDGGSNSNDDGHSGGYDCGCY
jgi:hypothetical protein